MGNFITDTVGKIASNVTQSVLTTVLISLITTYVLVGIGRKDDHPGVSAPDSTKKTSEERSDGAVPMLRSPESITNSGAAHRRPGNSPRENKPARTPPSTMKGGAEKKSLGRVSHGAVAPGEAAPTESGEAAGSSEILQESPQAGVSVGEELRRGTMGKASLPEDGPDRHAQPLTPLRPPVRDSASVEKNARESVRKVKKRADEVFDELDREAAQDSTP